MGSIELNVKDPAAWQAGRNEAYVSGIEGKLAQLDARSIAEKAISESKPGLGDRLGEGVAQIREGAERLTERMRGQREQERRREAWEVFGEQVSKHYLVVRDDRQVIGLYEPASKTPAITIERHKISTTHESGTAIADAVKLALDRGWTSLKVDGSQAFKDAVWLEAKKYDLKVGHNPSPLVRAEFERWRETHDVRPLPVSVPTGPAAPAAPQPEPQRDLAQAFMSKTPEQRLADPQLRNAELSAQAARDLAAQRFGAGDPKLKVAFASVDKIVTDHLRQGHKFSAPVMAARPTPAPKPDTRPQVERPRL